MRAGVVVGGILLVGAACGPAAATASARCGPAGAKTLAADRVARIYESAGAVYGCTDSSGRSYLLAANQSRPGQPHITKQALAGVDAAYGETTSGVDTASATVTVRRLDSGKTVRKLAGMTQPVGPEAFQVVDSIVVRKDGAVAWIASAQSIVTHSTQIEVDRADRLGESALDTQHGIDSTSLRLRGSELSWQDAGATRTATLL
jgi:hypothetical protein